MIKKLSLEWLNISQVFLWEYSYKALIISMP